MALAFKIRFFFWLLFILCAQLFGIILNPAIAQDAAINYQQQIRPIIVDHCLACHGVDAETREGGLRLDRRDEALRGGESNQSAIVPGKPDESELMRRITSQSPDELMPPASHGAPLSTEQVALLKTWIQAGANYEEHWAFVSPKKVEVPSANVAHPIDHMVDQHLTRKGLTLSPPEAQNILCRRIYLDIIGLPPTPAELAAFQTDGLEATIDRLLASERFGEKWARIWLDAARYSDTNGYEKDLKRDQWAWRDWVIRSFNNDKPYDEFIIEQIAGDLIPNATQDQIVATGFLRNSMVNEEGAIVPEQFRMVEMFDRMDCIGKSVLGLTTQCAQCHSHKFDPFTMHDYYGMFAYLNNTYEAQSWVYSSEQQAKRTEVLNSIAQLENEIKQTHPTWETELRSYVSQLIHASDQWGAITFNDMNSVSGLNHPTQEADLSLLMKGHTSGDVYFIGEPKLENATGLQVEVLTHADLPFTGPGRNSIGTWGIREVELFIQLPDAKDWQKIKLQNATADFSEPEQKHEEGKSSSGPVAFLVDGNDATWWKADRGTATRNQASVAVLQFETPLQAPAGTKVKIVMRMTDMVGCCRFSLTTAEKPSAKPVDYAAILSAQKTEAERSATEQRAIFDAWRKSVPALKPLSDRIDAQWKEYPAAETSILHAAERPLADARVTHLLLRGEWDKPAEPIVPSVPAAFHPLRDQTSPQRLRFAKWLVDRESPLAARVAVNRIWQSLFGIGLVETSEDFGTRAPMPEYRDLLDWLSVDFMENQWSTKKLIRQIVTSRTYQQSSRVSPQLMELDPDNRLLARGPRFRAEAEVVRDMAMAIAGLIHHEMGGPGVIPPVPQNVLDYNYVYPSYWTPAQGPQRYRRTIYNFRKRSMPDPAMSTFDAPNGDFACSRRMRSNTPLAALAGLNESIFIESAQAMALRILREGGPDEASRIDYAFQLCMARSPNETEQRVLLELLALQRKRIAEGWLNPREIVTGKADQLPVLPEGASPQDAAAWTIAARVLLNLDETISKN
jgi:mono/diheme cytochrome c family protein